MEATRKNRIIKQDSCCHRWYAAAAAKSHQSCPTLCNPIDGSPPGSSVPEILQARTLEWVAISFSNAWMWKVKVKSLSPGWLFATPWTAAYQAPPSMGFSRQEYWSGVPLPSLIDSIRLDFIKGAVQFPLKNFLINRTVPNGTNCLGRCWDPCSWGCSDRDWMVDVEIEEDQDVKTFRSLPTQRVCSFLCRGCLT